MGILCVVPNWSYERCQPLAITWATWPSSSEASDPLNEKNTEDPESRVDNVITESNKKKCESIVWQFY